MLLADRRRRTEPESSDPPDQCRLRDSVGCSRLTVARLIHTSQRGEAMTGIGDHPCLHLSLGTGFGVYRARSPVNFPLFPPCPPIVRLFDVCGRQAAQAHRERPPESVAVAF